MSPVAKMLTIKSVFTCAVLLAGSVSAHIEMKQPLALRSKFNPDLSGGQIDYNLKTPLSPDGSDYPCRGYQNDRPIRSVATYYPGGTYPLQLDGSATHGGGSCQVSLMYDNTTSFKVIKSMIGGCPLTLNYNFTIPDYAPYGNALLSWTWFNEIGNREMYQNCAWVKITAAPKAKRSDRHISQAKRTIAFGSLPNIWRANINGLSTCGTTEGADPVFPNLGPDVLYGGRMTSSSPDTSPDTVCDSSSPAGKLMRRPAILKDINALASAVSIASAAASAAKLNVKLAKITPAIASTSSVASYQQIVSDNTPQDTFPMPTATSNPLGGNDDGISATTTISTTSTPTANVNNVAPGLRFLNLNNLGLGNVIASSIISSISTPQSTETPTASTTSPTEPSTNDNDDNDLPNPTKYLTYATLQNSTLYLPCVPGSFLCTSPTTFLICDQAAKFLPMTPLNEYVGPMNATKGMECLPFIQEFPVNSTAHEFANGRNVLEDVVPRGYFRSDRYVKAST